MEGKDRALPIGDYREAGGIESYDTKVIPSPVIAEMPEPEAVPSTRRESHRAIGERIHGQEDGLAAHSSETKVSERPPQGRTEPLLSSARAVKSIDKEGVMRIGEELGGLVEGDHDVEDPVTVDVGDVEPPRIPLSPDIFPKFALPLPDGEARIAGRIEDDALDPSRPTQVRLNDPRGRWRQCVEQGGQHP